MKADWFLPTKPASESSNGFQTPLPRRLVSRPVRPHRLVASPQTHLDARLRIICVHSRPFAAPNRLTPHHFHSNRNGRTSSIPPRSHGRIPATFTPRYFATRASASASVDCFSNNNSTKLLRGASKAARSYDRISQRAASARRLACSQTTLCANTYFGPFPVACGRG
jgi:hypothetical protein